MIKNESVLSRWSRRKQQSERQTLEEDIHVELQQQGLEEYATDAENHRLIHPEEPGEDPKAPLTDADMPDIETLNDGSDFSGFMSPGVSDELRNLALRKLFAAPVFNLRDGLDEYDEDYTTFEKLGDIITCDMKHQMEMEAQKKLQQQQEALSDLDLDDSENDPEEEQEHIETEISQQVSADDEILSHHAPETEAAIGTANPETDPKTRDLA